MSISLTVNGQKFDYPESGDQNWGPDATDWASAVTTGMLQKSGGLFQILSEVDFGAVFGLKAIYYKSRSSSISETGILRLSNNDSITFRNALNDGDLSLNVVSNSLYFNGIEVLVGSIVNSNVDPSANIEFSKMESVTPNSVIISDGSGKLIPSSTSTTTLSYLDVSSSLQTSLNNKLSLSGGTLTGPLILSADPTNPLGAASKQYVDNSAQGLKTKPGVRLATTTSGTLASSFENGDVIDGIALITGDRILIKDQAAPAENGIYVVNATGAPTRAADSDTWDEYVLAYVFVSEGVTLKNSGWTCNAVLGGTLNVTPINFVQFSQAGIITTDGEGIEITGDVISLELDGTSLSKTSSGLKVSSTTFATIATKITDPMTTDGDLITRVTGVPARVGIGASGQVLTVDSGLPVWKNAPIALPTVTSVTGTLTLTSGQTGDLFLISTAATRTINLPPPIAGLVYTFKDSTGQANTNNITVVRNGGTGSIEGIASSKILQTNWGSWMFVCDGTNWFIL